jgi:hypothetical protein
MRCYILNFISAICPTSGKSRRDIETVKVDVKSDPIPSDDEIFDQLVLVLP